MKNKEIKEEKKVTLEELQAVLYKMNFYKINCGFIANDLFGNLCFFDTEPSFGGLFVTRENILTYINEY